MSYLQSITRLKGAGNMGGIVQLRIARKASIASMSEPVSGIIYGDIEFEEGQGWAVWDVTLETARARGDERNSREGAYKSNRLEFSIPKDRPGIKYMLDQAEADEFIILYKDSNAQNKIFGTLETPVRFEYGHDSGQAFGDRNEYACRFYYDGPDNRFDYNGIISAAPAGTPPSIVRFNGAVIAILNSGDILDITSDYSFNEYFTTSP